MGVLQLFLKQLDFVIEPLLAHSVVNLESFVLLVQVRPIGVKLLLMNDFGPRNSKSLHLHVLVDQRSHEE